LLQGGQQEDAEEFLGFYLDTLEEELLSLINTFPNSPIPTATPASVHESTDDQEAEGWLEVGRKNRPVMTRMVS